MPVGGVDDRVVTRRAQRAEETDEAQRVAERVGLLELHDPDAAEALGDRRPAAREQQIDPRPRERVAQRQRERHRQ